VFRDLRRDLATIARLERQVAADVGERLVGVNVVDVVVGHRAQHEPSRAHRPGERERQAHIRHTTATVRQRAGSAFAVVQ
jgi:hypothetical protein